eukprot:scaffold88869_cov72-Phaeocystis_antarctica.AAC.1
MFLSSRRRVHSPICGPYPEPAVCWCAWPRCECTLFLQPNRVRLHGGYWRRVSSRRRPCRLSLSSPRCRPRKRASSPRGRPRAASGSECLPSPPPIYRPPPEPQGRVVSRVGRRGRMRPLRLWVVSITQRRILAVVSAACATLLAPVPPRNYFTPIFFLHIDRVPSFFYLLETLFDQGHGRARSVHRVGR